MLAYVVFILSVLIIIAIFSSIGTNDENEMDTKLSTKDEEKFEIKK